jgi:excisionase family DNA binding protein
MTAPVPQPDLLNWPTREEAARLLVRSVATVDRWIADGKLATAERPRPGKKPAIVVNPADVERLMPKAPATPAYVDPPPAPSLEIARREDVGDAFMALVSQVRMIATATAQPVRFVGVKEAAGLTGLSVAYIERLVKSGELPHIRDGRRVKIRTRDLSTL